MKYFHLQKRSENKRKVVKVTKKRKGYLCAFFVNRKHYWIPFSSFNPRSNRDSGSSDESSEQGVQKCGTSTIGADASQVLTNPQQVMSFQRILI